jgi:hypothetical protein
MRLDIAGKTFTRASLKQTLRIIRDCYEPGQFITYPDHVAFLDECLREGNRINGLPIEDNVRWFVHLHENLSSTSKCFGFLREDNTPDYPSLDRLAQKKMPPLKPKAAARQDIAQQILEFKGRCAGKGGVFRCEGCDYESTEPTDFEVHHDIMPFTEIWECFLSEMGLVESEIGVVENNPTAPGDLYTFGMEYPFNFAFQLYHQKHAKLKLLCKRCHAGVTYGVKS